MCGIFLDISECPSGGQAQQEGDYDLPKLREYGNKISHRGPDSSVEKVFTDLEVEKNFYFLFHRLAINGLNEIGNQPMELNNKILMCNGEIYNYKELAKKYNITLKTGSDCEIILHLSMILPINSYIHMLDGVFSFVLYDKSSKCLTIGHDPLGVRPLYWSKGNDNDNGCKSITISSEMKSLTDNIEFYPPGSFSLYYPTTNKLHTYSYYNFIYDRITSEPETILHTIKSKLTCAVKKRLIGERPIGCLLSGGLDSSIITSIVCKFMEPSNVKTFSIGLEGSPDLIASEKVAKHLGTDHTSIVISEDQMYDAIDETIYQIESGDTTTIRASVPMFLLSKYISENTDIKVILSGEGSDEASGSYLYFHKAPTTHDFEEETIRLLKDVHMFDVLRADKTTAGNGLELRVPFFDKEFLNYYMGINPELKVVRDGMEKYLLRKSFEGELPDELLWRRKDGFSDGVSKKERPWYEIIDEKSKLNGYKGEKDLYSCIFNRYYGDMCDIIPYEWMPKWVNCESGNPSGRLILN
jgi:asparagine synthase (glutamine-hydrolysing)